MAFIDDSREAVAKRLWAKVERNGPKECWPWKGSISYKGNVPRGRLTVGNVVIPPQVAAYILEVGPIPDHRRPDQYCNNSVCCNPAHLDLKYNPSNLTYQDFPDSPSQYMPNKHKRQLPKHAIRSTVRPWTVQSIVDLVAHLLPLDEEYNIKGLKDLVMAELDADRLEWDVAYQLMNAVGFFLYPNKTPYRSWWVRKRESFSVTEAVRQLPDWEWKVEPEEETVPKLFKTNLGGILPSPGVTPVGNYEQTLKQAEEAAKKPKAAVHKPAPKKEDVPVPPTKYEAKTMAKQLTEAMNSRNDLERTDVSTPAPAPAPKPSRDSILLQLAERVKTAEAAADTLRDKLHRERERDNEKISQLEEALVLKDLELEEKSKQIAELEAKLKQALQTVAEPEFSREEEDALLSLGIPVR